VCCPLQETIGTFTPDADYFHRNTLSNQPDVELKGPISESKCTSDSKKRNCIDLTGSDSPHSRETGSAPVAYSALCSVSLSPSLSSTTGAGNAGNHGLVSKGMLDKQQGGAGKKELGHATAGVERVQAAKDRAALTEILKNHASRLSSDGLAFCWRLIRISGDCYRLPSQSSDRQRHPYVKTLCDVAIRTLCSVLSNKAPKRGSLDSDAGEGCLRTEELATVAGVSPLLLECFGK
jgi:hypothetical protein